MTNDNPPWAPPPATPPSAPAGWYADPRTGAHQYWDGWSWVPRPEPSWPAPSTIGIGDASPYAQAAADSTARGIATYERVSGVVWIVLGVVQMLSIVLIIAGIWNILAGISRLGVAPRIERRDAAVPQLFEGVVGLVLIGLVNLFFGAFIGVVMVGVDFYVRQRVLDNRHIFTR